jgi:acetylglutamate kinase
MTHQPSDISKTKVLKIGGAQLSGSLEELWKAVRHLVTQGPVVIVHGGGPQSTKLARAIGHEPSFVNGRRITGNVDLQILQWAVRGELNCALTAAAFQAGVQAAGLSGADSGLVQVQKRPVWDVNGVEIDFGFVGDVVSINPAIIEAMILSNIVPVIAPMGIDSNGALYNVNADTVAVEIAAALGAREIIFLTETGGVRKDPNSAVAPVLPHIDQDQIENGIAEGWISDGMHMKLTACQAGVGKGIQSVRVTSVEDVLDSESGTRVMEQVPC